MARKNYIYRSDKMRNVHTLPDDVLGAAILLTLLRAHATSTRQRARPHSARGTRRRCGLTVRRRARHERCAARFAGILVHQRVQHQPWTSGSARTASPPARARTATAGPGACSPSNGCQRMPYSHRLTIPAIKFTYPSTTTPKGAP